jgi:hypothetical protein
MDHSPRDEHPSRGGRLLFPALPFGRWTPWLLAAASAALIVLGLLQGNAPLGLLGVLGLACVLVAFPLARALLGPEPTDGSKPEE